MGVRAVTYYQVWCDADGCDRNAHEWEHSAWSDSGGAEDEATESDWEEIDGKWLCPDHQPDDDDTTP